MRARLLGPGVRVRIVCGLFSLGIGRWFGLIIIVCGLLRMHYTPFLLNPCAVMVGF